MEKFDVKIFGQRLKEIAKKDFGGVGKLAEKVGDNNISIYTSGAREPRVSTLFEFFKAGVDIIFLFTGKRGISVDADTKKKFAEMEQRLEKIESKMFRLLEENEKLKNVIAEKDNEIERLSVQSEKTLTLDVPSKLDKHKP